MTCLGNFILLKSQRSHLETLGYLVGYIIIKVGRVVHLKNHGFTFGTE